MVTEKVIFLKKHAHSMQTNVNSTLVKSRIINLVVMYYFLGNTLTANSEMKKLINSADKISAIIIRELGV